MSLYMTLPSNGSMTIHKDNTTANFVTQLHEPVHLAGGSWEMALVELHYPQTLFNVTKDQNYISVTRKTSVGKKKFRIYERVDIKPGYYETGEMLLRAINDAIKHLDINIAPLSDMDAAGCISIKNSKDEEHEINFAPKLAAQLGYGHNITDGVCPSVGRAIDVDAGTPKSIFVYCSVIEPQIVGDEIVPLLRIVNTQYKTHKFGEQVTQRFLNLLYVPVMMHEIRNIEIDLRDDTGNSLPFEAGTSAVVLHFRRRS